MPPASVDGARLVRVAALLGVCALAIAVAPAAHADTPPGRDTERGAWTAPLQLTHAAFDLPPSVADTVVHVPAGFDPAPPLHLVVLLHGWSCCAASFVGEAPCGPTDPARHGWNVARAHDRARTNTILIAPQLAWLERSSSPGRFAEPGFFRAWLDEVLAGPLAARIGRANAEVGSVTLVAHSAGYQTALAILANPAVPITNVVLFDALYGGTERFAEWVAGSPPNGPRRHLVNIHTTLRSTTHQSARLARLTRARMGEAAVSTPPITGLRAAVRTHAVVIAKTPRSHAETPTHHLPEVLAGLSL